MLPRSSLYDMFNSPYANVVFFTQFFSSYVTSGIFSPKGYHGIFLYFGATATLLASFLNHVIVVFFASSVKQMTGIKARRDIASVTSEIIWKFSVQKFECKSRNSIYNFVYEAFSIALAFAEWPYKAFIRVVAEDCSLKIFPVSNARLLGRHRCSSKAMVWAVAL